MRERKTWKCYVCGLIFKTKSIAELHERVTNHKPTVIADLGGRKL